METPDATPSEIACKWVRYESRSYWKLLDND